MEELNKRKEELLNNLKEEINTLEHEVKYANLINKKKKCICNLKIARNISKYYMPFVLAGTISFSGFYYIDNYEKPTNEQTQEKTNYDESNLFAYYYLLLSLPISEVIAYDYQKKKKIDLKKENSAVSNNYIPINKDTKEKILRIKKDNYEFLTK